MIIFNENQRKMFECIPKPEVMVTKNKISLDSLIKYKKHQNSRIMMKNIPNVFFQETDPFTKRIMEFFDSNIIDAKNSKNEGFWSF